MPRRGLLKRCRGPVLAGAVILASLLLADTTFAGRGGKPDLVPAGGELRGKPYAFYGKQQDFSIKYKVKNRGRSSVDGVASKLYFIDEFDERYKGDIDGIPGRIKPGKSANGTLKQESTSKPLPAGAYKLELCVDFSDVEDESDEGNNCEVVDGARFYSTYREWRGRISGQAPGFDGAVTRWSTSQLASFTFKRYLGGGAFEWKLDGGSVSHRMAGGTSCTYTGAGTLPLVTGTITIDHRGGVYAGTAKLATNASYNIVVDCGGFTYNLASQAGILPVMLMQNQEFFSGSESLFDKAGIGTNEWEWNLKGR